MSDKTPNEAEGFDAPQAGPAPEDINDRVSEEPLAEIAEDGRDPSRVPADTGKKRPEIAPRDEQAAGEQEVLEGIDRAENDQRRVADSPTERDPGSE